MVNNNRREFLKKSFLGISGVALLPSSMKVDPNLKGIKTSPSELPSRLLGKTGISTPLISMGTSGVTSPGFVRAAYEAGIRLFFSATYYGEGNNEILVGEGLKGLQRDSFIVGTASTPDGLETRSGTLPGNFSAQAYMKKAEESLKRFGLDHIDILLFPYAAKKETVLHEGILKTMEQVKKQGKARFTGIASHGYTVEALDAAAGSGVYDVAMISYNFKIQDLDSLNASIANAVNKGMGVIAMKTTAGAALDKSGPAINTSAALKWVLQNEKVSTIVSGMTSLDEMQRNLLMIRDLKISEQEMRDLKIASIRSGTGLYCQQCRQCIPQCPHNLDIPAIMRSYMYLYGYRNTEQAWHTLEEAGLSANLCDKCETCNVDCVSGFDMKKKITDISRIKNVPTDFLLA
jgi:hypothetical protein